MSQRATIEALAGWLMERDDILLLGHVSPDGDATGSTLGLWHTLKALGKRAVVCLPGGMPGLYAMLPGAAEVLDVTDPPPFEPKTAFAVDVSEPERLGEAGIALFNACPHRAVLDHHNTNRGFGQLYTLDGEAAAAGELAVDLIEALGVKMTPEMAECLFVAISTDCGQFSYANTRPGTFQAAARCVGAGADISRITEVLYRTRSAARTRLLGVVLAGLELSGDGKIAWARLTEDMLRQTGAKREDSEGVVNYLQEIEGVMISLLAMQRGEETKLSLRCRSGLNVARDVAVPLGGGGHDCAAGVTLPMPMDKAIEKGLEYAKKALGRE